MKKFVSTKSYSHIAPVAYRQWRAESHCNLVHGYSLSFHFEFEALELDIRNWVVDFGSLRELKQKLEEWFDHKLLVAEDDPNRADFEELAAKGLAKITYVEATGCEAIAQFLYDYINDIMLPSWGADVADRVWCTKVQVRETPSNMAMVTGHRDGTCDCGCK